MDNEVSLVVQAGDPRRAGLRQVDPLPRDPYGSPHVVIDDKVVQHLIAVHRDDPADEGAGGVHAARPRQERRAAQGGGCDRHDLHSRDPVTVDSDRLAVDRDRLRLLGHLTNTHREIHRLAPHVSPLKSSNN